MTDKTILCWKLGTTKLSGFSVSKPRHLWNCSLKQCLLGVKDWYSKDCQGQKGWTKKLFICFLLHWNSWFVRGLFHRRSINPCPWCWILSSLCGHPWQPLVTIASKVFWNMGTLLPFSELCHLVWHTRLSFWESTESNNNCRLFRDIQTTAAEKENSFLFYPEAFQWGGYPSALGASFFVLSIMPFYITLCWRRVWKEQHVCRHSLIQSSWLKILC